MIHVAIVEAVGFLVVFGLMCFGLGVIFMQSRRLKELNDNVVKQIAEIEEIKKVSQN